MCKENDKPSAPSGMVQPVVSITPVTVDMEGDAGTIQGLQGLLEQQKKYTQNAVDECMRLRRIIAEYRPEKF